MSENLTPLQREMLEHGSFLLDGYQSMDVVQDAINLLNRKLVTAEVVDSSDRKHMAYQFTATDAGRKLVE